MVLDADANISAQQKAQMEKLKIEVDKAAAAELREEEVRDKTVDDRRKNG